MRRPAEQAFVLPATLVLLLVVGMLLTAMLISDRTAGDEVNRRGQSTRVFSVAEVGFERYRAAVNSRVASWNNGYAPTLAEWQARIAGPGEQVVETSTLSAHERFVALGLHQTPLVPASRAVTLTWPIHTDDDGRVDLRGWVQPMAILGRDPTRPETTIYLRAWTSSADNSVVQEPLVHRFALRPVYFSDFQLLVDGPVQFLGGQISAPVHSNGYPDSYIVETAFNGSERMRMMSPTSCREGSRLSTASGTITTTGSCAAASVPRRQGTGDVVNLLRTRDTFQQVRAACPTSARARCFTGTATRTARLSGTSVTVSGAGGGTWSTLPWLALSFEGDVVATGTISSGSLTIAAGGVQQFGGSKIIVQGPGAVGAGGTNASVGLIAEGDVELALGGSNCAGRIGAAIASTGGALSIPGRYRTWVLGGAPSSLPTCGQLEVNGSVASHYAPLVRMNFTPFRVGFSQVSYRYDPVLRLRPPPFWPTDDKWAVTGQGAANRDCLAAANITRRACA